MRSKLFSTLKSYLTPETAYAHCDIPCGIYDPHTAQIGALTVIRMTDLVAEQDQHGMIRATAVKEEHAEKVKHEVRILWGDYFKAEHLKTFPEIHELVHEIMMLGSKVKQEVDRKSAVSLLDKVNRFTEIFWQTKDIKTKRVKAPYKPEEEIVVPILD